MVSRPPARRRAGSSRRSRKPSSRPRITPSHPAPALPTDGAEYENRKNQILQRARAIFIRHGYRKTTIEDIGRACGLGKAALYHYFSGKEDIFAEVVRTEGEKVLAQIRAAVREAGDPKAQLTAMITTSFNAVSVIASELTEHRSTTDLRESLPLAARNLDEFQDEEVRILESILDAGWRQGIFKKVRAPSVPLMIAVVLRGVEMYLLEARDPLPADAAIDALLELFLEGICR